MKSPKGMTVLVALLWGCMIMMAWAAGNYPQPTICDRTCWSARSPQCSISQEPDLNRAVIHYTCAASDYDTDGVDYSASRVRAHQNYHMDSLGWCDIGYHFLIDKLGNNFEGREGSMSSYPRGAHDGDNTCSFGFSTMGYWHDPYNQAPPCEMRMALYDVIAWKMPEGYSPYGGGSYGSDTAGFLCGHRDVYSTSCPGDLLYDFLGTDLYGGESRNEVDLRITTGSGTDLCGPTPTPTPTPEPGTDVIVDNDDGSPAYTETGGWSTSSSSGYNDGTYRFAATGDPNTATWTGNLAQDGNYDVKVIYRASTNRATSTQFEINASDGTHNVYVDQTQNNLVWVYVGTYSFLAGDNTITLDALDSSGGDVVIADAVRFTLVTEPTPTPTATAEPTPTPTETPTPTPTAEPGEVYVYDITVVKQSAGVNKYATATVWIKDDTGADVEGATVTGDWSDAVTGSSQGITGTDGKVVLESSKTKNDGEFTFCVTNVEASGYSYNESLNNETCDSTGSSPTPTPTPTETPTPTPTPTPTETPEGYIYVNDIAMSYKSAGPNISGLATVWIKDDSGADVGSATVYGDWSGATSESQSGTTGSDGKVTFESSKVRNGGTFTFCVTNVEASGYTYDDTMNMETCDSITAP